MIQVNSIYDGRHRLLQNRRVMHLVIRCQKCCIGKTGQVGDVKALLVNEGQGNNVINRIVD